MKYEHDIKWFLDDPERLLLMKPFTRGGVMEGHGWEGQNILQNTVIDTGCVNMNLTPISQDTYITEYRPDLHHIILNKSIPHIKVVIDGAPLPSNMLEITHTASFQKLIHSAHVRSLTANPLEFNLFSSSKDENGTKTFEEMKEEWTWRNVDYDLYNAINTCKQLGNCGVLFHYDKEKEKYGITTYSYEDGYQFIPNYNEYGVEIARTLTYYVDEKRVIDTYDSKRHYRTTEKNNGWETTVELHGYGMCPLLIKRGKVAWEYAESSIEMWELMTNINAIALKRFGTFALAFWGDMDGDSFTKDSSTLIVNLSSEMVNGGKQDVKVLEFPEPQTMDKYLKTLEEKISLFSSTSFITPKDITTTNSGGNGIALAMSNDYSLAMQSAMDWRRFVNEMLVLHQQGLDLETNGIKHYGDLKVSAKIIPWSLETNNTKITNLAMEAPYLSTKTIVERCPDAAPDELQRIVDERGAVVERGSNLVAENADKANNIAKNRSNEIVDNMTKVVDIEPVTVNS